MSFSRTAEKYIAAKNALVAKHTIGSLGDDQKNRVDECVTALLAAEGIAPARAGRYKSLLRETQYYGMAALAMARLDIQPSLRGILFRDRWEQVWNPLVALTGAEKEIEMASNEIVRKHRVLITLSDGEKRSFGHELPALQPGGRGH